MRFVFLLTLIFILSFLLQLPPFVNLSVDTVLDKRGQLFYCVISLFFVLLTRISLLFIYSGIIMCLYSNYILP